MTDYSTLFSHIITNCYSAS